MSHFEDHLFLEWAMDIQSHEKEDPVVVSNHDFLQPPTAVYLNHDTRSLTFGFGQAGEPAPETETNIPLDDEQMQLVRDKYRMFMVVISKHGEILRVHELEMRMLPRDPEEVEEELTPFLNSPRPLHDMMHIVTHALTAQSVRRPDLSNDPAADSLLHEYGINSPADLRLSPHLAQQYASEPPVVAPSAPRPHAALEASTPTPPAPPSWNGTVTGDGTSG